MICFFQLGFSFITAGIKFNPWTDRYTKALPFGFKICSSLCRKLAEAIENGTLAIHNMEHSNNVIKYVVNNLIIN